MEVNETPMKAVDAFEHWLQGRINLCVEGLISRIRALEEAVIKQHEKIEKLEANGAVFTQDKFDEMAGNYFSGQNIDDVFGYNATWDMVEDDVQTAISDVISDALKDSNKLENAVENAVDSWCSQNLEDKVKDIIKDDITFEVTVS